MYVYVSVHLASTSTLWHQGVVLKRTTPPGICDMVPNLENIALR